MDNKPPRRGTAAAVLVDNRFLFLFALKLRLQLCCSQCLAAVATLVSQQSEPDVNVANCATEPCAEDPFMRPPCYRTMSSFDTALVGFGVNK